MNQVLRIAAGGVALAAGWYAIVIGIDLADVLTRPINQGWLEVLLILFLPLFIGVVVLTAIAAMLGRYAWRGTFR